MKNRAFKKLLRIGELAKEAEVTVRTLHHYDQIGLLQPTADRETGHRLYTRNDLERLQQIISLKSMGFSLEEIQRILSEETYDLQQILIMQKSEIRSKVDHLLKMQESLELMLAKLSRHQDLSIKELFSFIRETKKMEKFYTPEQLQKLRERLEKTDPKKIKTVEEAWPKLFQKFEQALQQGVSPSDPSVQKLALEAQNYIDQFTGGDKAIEASMESGYQAHQETALKAWGVSKQVFDYTQQARKILKERK